ncbi:MAG: hypothetical protein U0894_11235 [Pirellulales bacterium]
MSPVVPADVGADSFAEEVVKAFVENRSPFKRQALISTLQTDAKYLARRREALVARVGR